MKKSLLLGTLLGGIIAFFWSWVSWDVLPWHESNLLAFQNEDMVAHAITANTTQSGIYLFPGGPAPGLSKEQKKAAAATQMAKMGQGTIIFAAVRRSEGFSFASGLIKQISSQLLAAFLMTWLLLQTRGLSFWGRVGFLTVAGLTASVICDLPNWNWWGFSTRYTIVQLADNALTWYLAGLAIAKVANPSAARQ